MPLLLTLRTISSIPLEVDSIRLDRLRDQSPADVARIPIQCGNQQVPLGEFFDVSGSAADGEMIWQGDCSRVKWIGAGLSNGRIRVEGNAGMHLGAAMTGGEILCTGDAADWAGAEMRGGRIIVQGDAGHLVGAAYRGGRRGMTGGEIFIQKNAGNEIGRTMRRGLIAVGGRCGDAVGFNMLAGTVIVFGEAGRRPGAGMRRGTIALLGAKAPRLLPTFHFACVYEPVFLRSYLRAVCESGLSPPNLDGVKVRRYCGDFLESGKGEILLRAA